MIPIIDLHCDLPVYLLMNEKASPYSKEIGVGLPFLKEGNVALQVMAIFTAVEGPSAKKALAQSILYKKLLTDYSDHFIQAQPNFNVDDSDKVGIVASLESASGLCNEDDPLDNAFENLENILSNVERLFYISLTHHTENRFGGGNYSRAGLKSDGEELLEYISGKQIAIDLSHTSDVLAFDILDHTYKNVPGEQCAGATGCNWPYPVVHRSTKNKVQRSAPSSKAAIWLCRPWTSVSCP